MSKTTRVSEAIARPARTGPQAVVAFAIVEFIDSFINDLTEKQYGAAVGLLVLILAGVQVIIENGVGKALFRKVPPTEAPIVEKNMDDDEGEISPGMERHEDSAEDNVGEVVEPDHDLNVDEFVEDEEIVQ